MSDTNCPYCDAEIDIYHRDGEGYTEDVLHEQKCRHCLSTFVFTTHVMYSYTPYKAPCLNEGGEHKYEPTTTFPKECTRMRCIWCSAERNCTEQEMKNVLRVKLESRHIEPLYEGQPDKEYKCVSCGHWEAEVTTDGICQVCWALDEGII